MFKTGMNIPEQPQVPPMPESYLKAEYDRLYLEKCKEVNELERKVESYRNMAEIAIKQKRQFAEQLVKCEEQIEAYEKTIRELSAELLTGFTPDVEPPEELPEELAESVPLWASQAVSSQDILCLSSALKNLYEIHKCDGWLLYTKLAKVLEQKIEEYCKEEG